MAAYRRFRHWFDAELEGKDIHYVEDAIATKAEHYKAALAKHGVRARRGEILSCLAKTAMVGAAIAGVGWIAGPEMIASVCKALGYVFTSESVVAKVEEIRRDERTQRVSGQGSEVAFVHQIYELGRR